ncbi:MAG: hypothetical protein WC821_05400 [archaeon]|jgi:hypothetical protein
MNANRLTKPSASSSIAGKKPVKTGMQKKLGRWFVAAATAGIVGLTASKLLKVAEQRAAANKVPLAQERSTIANIYGLNTNKVSDLKVLNFIDSVANKENISRGRVLQTLEKNHRDSYQIVSIDNKLRSVTNPAEKERLKRIRRILISTVQDEQLNERLDEMMQKKGTLKQVEKKLR